MADSTNPLDQIEQAQAAHATKANELIDALSPAAFGGRRAETCAGLTWGINGGRWGGTSVAATTVSLTASTTNYVVALRSTGAFSVATATTNWDNTATYARLYKIVAGASTVTSYEDHRLGAYGIFYTPPTSNSTQGRHAIYISAAAMRPSVTGGCAAVAAIASAANQPDIVSLDFDAAAQEYAQFGLVMPKKWNLGTVTFKPHWSHAATTVNFGVVWDLQAVAVSNDDAIAVAFGTAQTSTDTGGTTNDLYTGPESSAITVGGTPAAEDMVFFRASRIPTDGADTLAVDARLHGITLYITTNADTDA